MIRIEQNFVHEIAFPRKNIVWYAMTRNKWTVHMNLAHSMMPHTLGAAAIFFSLWLGLAWFALHARNFTLNMKRSIRNIPKIYWFWNLLKCGTWEQFLEQNLFFCSDNFFSLQFLLLEKCQSAFCNRKKIIFNSNNFTYPWNLECSPKICDWLVWFLVYWKQKPRIYTSKWTEQWTKNKRYKLYFFTCQCVFGSNSRVCLNSETMLLTRTKRIHQHRHTFPLYQKH